MPSTADDPFSTSGSALDADDSTFETDSNSFESTEDFGDSAIQVDNPEELDEAGEALESFLEVGDDGSDAYMEEPPQESIDTSPTPAPEAPEYTGSGEDEGMVEFFVEDDSGQIERVETRATDEQPPVERAPVKKLTGEETVEMPAMDFTEEEPGAEDQPDDGMVQTPETPVMKKPAPAARWRDPGKGSKRHILASEQDAKPSSGTFYLVFLILIGIGGMTSNFVDLGTWRFDPVWSGALIFFGILGFFLQNLSGLYVSGFFTLFYGFGLFSRQQANLENNILAGVWHLLVLLAIGFIFMLVYYLLMNRRRGHFIIQEGQGQSTTALLVGFAALLTGVFGHMASQSLPRLGELVFMGTPLQEIAYYAGVSLPVIIQSAVAAAAVAFGFSAFRVRNRGLLFAGIGILFGLLVYALLYMPMLSGEVQIPLPF